MEKEPQFSAQSNGNAVGDAAAKLVRDQLLQNPRSVFGLPTGSTPRPMYERLIEDYRHQGLDFSKATFFNLDEYIGLPPEHPQSYHFYMTKHFFSQVNAHPSCIHIPFGMARDIRAECLRYEEDIRKAGGIDVMLLGIGRNGHIGFNEPGTSFQSRTHEVRLTPETRKDNAIYFKRDEVPARALTMGIATISDARMVVLMASGTSKASAIQAFLTAPVSTAIPATSLRLHPNVTVIADRHAYPL